MQDSSAIYECTVMHHRLRPKQHKFRYNVFYLWLDLDELDDTARRLKMLGKNKPAFFSVYDRDHMDNGGGDMKACLLKYLNECGLDTKAIAKVKLLTFPRVLGYIFNPVCFYYTFDASGRALHAVAEVTNTYHEQKPYVLHDWEKQAEDQGRFRLITPKLFYVSPFSELEMCFDFKLRVPGESLEIHIDDRDAEGRVLLSTLTGKRRPLTDGALLACAVKYPLLTLRVIFLIHWHALLLWIKRVPFHRKADRPELQRGVMRPHSSLVTPE